MIKKAENEFGKLIDTLVDELIAMPDATVLEDIDSAAVQAEGERLLQAAIVQSARARLSAAKAGVLRTKARPVAVTVVVTPDEARYNEHESYIPKRAPKR